jgi:hypothetical protein
LTWKNDNAHVRTGTTNEFDIQAGMPQSKGISVDAQTDLEFVHVARALLGAQAHEPLLLAAQQALKLPESEKP